VTDPGKVRENRARRIAQRRGYRLEKSRRRDPLCPDYGLYQLISAATGSAVLPGAPWMTLAEAEWQIEILSAVRRRTVSTITRAIGAPGA
jgi:hypothetical protein